MSDQSPSSIGTVAEEAARLIAAVATMARAGAAEGDEPSHRSSPYAGWPAQDEGVAPEPMRPQGEDAQGWQGEDAQGRRAEDAHRPRDRARPDDAPPEGPSPTGARSPGSASSGACVECGRDGAATPFACRVCPLCQGIALLRSVRPETVDRLADFASVVAGSLREMATMSRADGQDSQARSTSGSPSNGATVQDIRVDDEDEVTP